MSDIVLTETTKLHLRLSPDSRKILENLSEEFEVPQTGVLIYALSFFNQLCKDDKVKSKIEKEIQECNKARRQKAFAERGKRNQAKVQQGALFGRAASAAKRKANSPTKTTTKATKITKKKAS